MGTKVGCVMRRRLAERVGRTYSTPTQRALEQERHDVERDRRGPFGVVEDLLVGRAQVGAGRQRLTGTGVAVEERMGATRHLQADPVAGEERVGGGPQRDAELAHALLPL